MENSPEKIQSVRELKVYKKAFESAMEIFQISKSFPCEEKFSSAFAGNHGL